MKTTQATHTPGPWSILVPPHGSDEIRADETGYLICELPYGSDGEPEAANASLIAAAPELLEALQRIAGWFRNQPGSRLEDLPDDFICAALARAQGGAL